MILGLGLDAANIDRFSNPVEGLVKRILSPSEIVEYNALKDSSSKVRAAFLASRFAVKEAYAKARGTGFCADVSPVEISTVHDAFGKPSIELCGRTKDTAIPAKIILSLTHEEPLAVAVVIIEGADNGKN